jgi:hypothetical protein
LSHLWRRKAGGGLDLVLQDLLVLKDILANRQVEDGTIRSYRVFSGRRESRRNQSSSFFVVK